jgi:hypothetical protein
LGTRIEENDYYRNILNLNYQITNFSAKKTITDTFGYFSAGITLDKNVILWGEFLDNTEAKPYFIRSLNNVNSVSCGSDHILCKFLLFFYKIDLFF